MGHEDDCFSAMFNGVFDCWEGADDALVVCDFGVGLLVEWDIKVDLQVQVLSIVPCSSRARRVFELVARTRMRIRLSLRSQSVMASLLDRDMFGIYLSKLPIAPQWIEWKKLKSFYAKQTKSMSQKVKLVLLSDV